MPTDNNDKKQNQSNQPENPLDDTLAWLESLALDEGAKDAPETSKPVESKDQTKPQKPTTDDQLQWLDALASEDEAIEEQPTLSWEHTKPTNDLLSPSLPLTSDEDTASEGWATDWLENVDQDEETTLEDLENLLFDEEPPAEQKPPETLKKTEVTKKKSSGGMFGADEDFTISEEEIAAAAAGGMEVDGFDFPGGDDDEAAMAWLEGLIGGDDAGEPDLIVAEEPAADDLFALALEEDDQSGAADDWITDDILALAADSEPEPEPQAVEPPPAPPPPVKKKKSGGGMFGADEDFTISEEEIAAAAAGGMEVDGFDFPDGDDDEAAMAWLEGLIGGDDDGGLDMVAGEAEPEPEPQAVEPPPAPPPPVKKKKSGGGMFGADEDFTISEEEIAAAAAGGMEVDGFDFPDGDDDEAAMAWLEGLIGGDDDGGLDMVTGEAEPEPAAAEDEGALDDLFALALEEDSQSVEASMDDLLALATEPEPEPEPQAVEPPPAPPPPVKKKKSGGGMFGADEDFTISEEEIAAAAAGGMEVEGFDFPGDDDDAAMAWLEGLIGEVPDVDEIPSTVAVTDTIEDHDVVEVDVPEPVTAEMAESDTSLFDDLLFTDDGEDDDAVTVTNPDEALRALLALADEQDALDEDEPVPAPVLEDEPRADVASLGLDDDLLVDSDDDAGDPLSWLEMDGDLPDLPEDEMGITQELLALDEVALDVSEIDDPDGELDWLTNDSADNFESMVEGEPLLEDGLLFEDDPIDAAVPNFDFDQDLPDDPDEAMRLLEQLAADQDGAAQEELGTPLTMNSELDLLDLGIEEESGVSDLFAEVDEPAPTLSFLEDDPLDAMEAEPEPAEQAAEMTAEDDALLDDDFGVDAWQGLDLGNEGGDSLSWLDDSGEFGPLPEDPDEAMAMLEQLSSDMDDSGELELDALEFESELDDLIDLDEEVGDPTQDPPAVDELFPEAVSSALPEWFAISGSETGDTFTSLDWLGADGGGDGGILGWLESEEEVGQRGDTLTSNSILDGLDILDSSPAPREREITRQMRPSEEVTEESEVVERPVYDPSIFRPARAMISAGDMDGALEEYTDFMKDNNQILILVDELEQVVNSVTKHPLMQRLLGDAYMRSGQLQEALNMYTLARDQL